MATERKKPTANPAATPRSKTRVRKPATVIEQNPDTIPTGAPEHDRFADTELPQPTLPTSPAALAAQPRPTHSPHSNISTQSSLPSWMAALSQLSLLQWAFAISIAFHAVLLAVRFVDPDAINRAFKDTPLEVILVNAKSQLKPEVAQAIAQANLDGGGASEKGRAKSPMPSAALNAEGDAAVDERKRVEDMQDAQSRLLAQVKSALAQRPEDFKSVTDEPSTSEEERRKQLMKMLAEIEARIDEENKRPRKRFISPATREAAYAQYYDALKKKIELRGTENFPALAGQKLYGELTMVMVVDKRGRVKSTEIVQGSGNRRLDRMAEAIAVSSGPFGAFSAEMMKSADEVEVVSRFKFSRDETLSTTLEANQ
jgi:periplasmic protein TonB